MTIPFLDLSASIAEQRTEIDAAIARVLSSGHVLLGKELEAFEREWAAWCETRFAIGVSNGLDALHLILRAWGIGPGDEVIVPSNTYIASWLAVSYSGARPVPVEPELDTCLLDPSRIEAAITPRTKALMPVHLYGHPCEMAPILEVAKKYNLHVLEDAAQAHGASYAGRRIGGHGHAVAWSFYPTKNLGALGDAGAITTDDEALAKQLRMLRNYGSSVRYINEVAGFNCRLEELHAAVLRVKLSRLDAWNARRTVLASRYQSAFGGTTLTLPVTRPGATHAWHLYTVRHAERNALKTLLEQRGVGTMIHYPIAPHLQTAYSYLGYKEGDFPLSEQIHREILSLPLSPQLTDEQQDHIIEAVLSSLETLH